MPFYDLVVKNGTVVSAFGTVNADIAIRNGKIASLGDNFNAKEVIDAKNLLVFPGGVDVHTHLDMPFMGTFSSDDFESGSIAALYGGTTAIVDFAMQEKNSSLENTLLKWMNKADGKSLIDYGLHMSVTDVNTSTLSEIKSLVKRGITTFKLFMAYNFACNDLEILRVLEELKDCGGLPLFHAENGNMITYLTEKLLFQSKVDAFYHKIAHSEIAESEATFRAVALAELISIPIYIVHLSSHRALEHIIVARRKGVSVFSETCPQYLLLTDEKYKGDFYESSKYVMSPPLREKRDNQALWNGIENGFIQVIATDHCPFLMKQKILGDSDFTKIPNGIPGIETRISLMYSEGVAKKRISLKRFVEICCTNPSILMGLYPRKGIIACGADADIVLFDPKAKYTLTNDKLHHKCDYTPFEGFKITGSVVKVIVKGDVKLADGQLLNKDCQGTFIKRNNDKAYGKFL
jgi:dihydropyrimidinase